MRLLILAALALPASASVAKPDQPKAATPKLIQPRGAETAANCPQSVRHYAVRPGERLQPHKLGELPPANHYAAVYRRVNGCEVPLVINYRVGARR